MKYYSIRPSILSELFINLAAGWLGLVVITPTVLLSEAVEQTVVGFIRAIIGGFLCLLIAELFRRLEVTS